MIIASYATNFAVNLILECSCAKTHYTENRKHKICTQTLFTFQKLAVHTTFKCNTSLIVNWVCTVFQKLMYTVIFAFVFKFLSWVLSFQLVETFNKYIYNDKLFSLDPLLKTDHAHQGEYRKPAAENAILEMFLFLAQLAVLAGVAKLSDLLAVLEVIPRYGTIYFVRFNQRHSLGIA